MQRILQSKLFLGAMSFLIVLTGTLFVLTPMRTVHAQASIEIQRDHNGIVIFGQAKQSDGSPVGGLQVAVGIKRSQSAHENTRIIDQTRTNTGGNYKLWISNNQVPQLRSQDVVFIVTPDNGTQFEQTLDVDSGDVALINIQMRTPLIPIFPLNVFVY